MGDAVVVRCLPGNEGWCAVLAHALVAFFGDYTCSAQNTEASCFGAEWCDRNIRMAAPSSYMTDLMQNNRCYAALDAETKRFLGIAAVSATHTLHCFCVVDAARGRGVGRLLMDHVLLTHGSSRMDLTVAGHTSTSGHGADTLRERHDRLVQFYESYGFRKTGVVVDGYTTMVRPPTWSGEIRRGNAFDRQSAHSAFRLQSPRLSRQHPVDAIAKRVVRRSRILARHRT